MFKIFLSLIKLHFPLNQKSSKNPNNIIGWVDFNDEQGALKCIINNAKTKKACKIGRNNIPT